MEDRSKFIGGSDIAAVLGISPWKTPYQLWVEKTEPTEPEEDAEREKRFTRGKRLEPLIIEMLQEERDVYVLDRNTRHVHPTIPYLTAQIDYEYAAPDSGDSIFPPIGNGETKSVSPFMVEEWGPDGSQEIPIYYATQVMFGLAVTGRQEATVAALIGDDLRCYRFERDDELCTELVSKAVDFWENHVLTGKPPEIQSKTDATHFIRKFKGFTFEASEQLQQTISSIGLLRYEKRMLEKRLKEREESAMRQIVSTATFLGVEEGAPDNFIATGPDGAEIMTWKLQHRAGYTVEPTEFRVLRVKGEKP